MQKDYIWNPSTCICENSKNLKSIADTSVTECDETIIVMDNLSTKKTNTIATKKKYIMAAKKTYYSKKCYEYYFSKFS